MVFFFTGTGNSRYVAQRVQNATADKLLSINDQIRKENDPLSIQDEKLVFVFPTYAWRIPRVAEEWIGKTNFHEGSKAWFIMTCGSEIGNAGEYLRRLCLKKGLRFMGVIQIIMPENYITLFSAPSDEKARQIIDEACSPIAAAVSMIQRDKAFPDIPCRLYDRIASGLINPAFYPLFVKANAFRVKDSCIHCGKCAQLCPLNNIRLTNRKPVWGKQCTQCMACIAYCPVQAIEYGKKSSGKTRYTLEKVIHSDVKEEQ